MKRKKEVVTPFLRSRQRRSTGRGGEREWTMTSVGWRGDLNAWEMNKPYGAGGARLSFQKKEEQMQHKTLTVNGHLCCGFNNWRKDVDVIKTISADEQ